MGREGERWNKCSPGRLEKGTFDCSNFLPDIGRCCAWNGFNKMLRLHSRSENLLWGETPGGCQNVQGEVRDCRFSSSRCLAWRWWRCVLWQVPLYEKMPVESKQLPIQICTKSNLGDPPICFQAPSSFWMALHMHAICATQRWMHDIWSIIGELRLSAKHFNLFFSVCVKVRCQAPRLTKGLWADWVPLRLSDNRRYFEALASCWWLST